MAIRSTMIKPPRDADTLASTLMEELEPLRAEALSGLASVKSVGDRGWADARSRRG